MDHYSIRCLQSLAEFQSVRRDWDQFTASHFPGNYNRTHAWLSAWWATYHHDRPALIYIQRRLADGKITAVAPLFTSRELLGGLPILSLQALGVGVGTDDFLSGPEARGFVGQVLSDLVNNRRWHVARFRRIRNGDLCRELNEACAALACPLDAAETDDYYIEFPASFRDYLHSRSRNFRSSLRVAGNRAKKEGTVTMQVLDPIAEPDRVWAIGREVSAKSWQFQQGKSHFNDKGFENFYANLSRAGHGVGGEEFSAMLIDHRPVAYLLGCLRERTFFAVDTAFNADYSFVSAGLLLLCGIIERLIEQGTADYFDFEGGGEYKAGYATHVRKATFLTMYNRSLYPRLIRSLRSSRAYDVLGGVLRRPDHHKG